MLTSVSNIAKNISDAVDELGKKGVAGIQFETADPRLLDIRDSDFNDHVAMQPAAIAYYGMLKKTANRNLDAMKRAYDRWQKKVYSQAKQALMSAGTTKPTVNDIEAFVLLNHESQIEKFEKDLENLQEQVDHMDVWYEAWHQKSYTIREHGALLSDERRTSPYISDQEPASTTPAKGFRRPASAVAEERSSSFDRVRRIMRKSREGKEEDSE